MRGIRSLVGLAVVAALLSVPLMAAGAGVVDRARPVLGPIVRLSGPQAVGQDISPTTVWDAAANEYLVVWVDSREWDEGAEEWVPWGRLRGQRVGADGAPIGSNFSLSGRRGSDQSLPAVACNSSSGEYLVVWMDLHGEVEGIFGRRLSASGVPLGRAFRIDRISGPRNRAPAVAYNPDADEYLVTWMDKKSADIGLAVYGRRISGAGVREGARFCISGPNARIPVLDYAMSMAVAYGAGEHLYLAAWEDWRHGFPDIYGRWVTSDGVRPGSDFRISGRRATRWEFLPALAYSPAAGEFLVTWDDWRRGDMWPEHYSDIYGRLVAEGGSPVGPDFYIGGTATTYGASSPDVAWNTVTGEYLVVFDDTPDGEFYGDDICGRRVGADGQRLGEPFRLTGLYTPGNESRPALAWNATANQYLVVWVDDRTFPTRGYDIRARTLAG